MYSIDCEATVTGELDAIWTAWSDMAAYPSWDPREEELRLDGPFAAGTTGFSKQVGPRPGSSFSITRVDAKSGWTNESPLPGGKLVIDHRLIQNGDGTVRLIKRYEAYGPMSIAFRLVFARGIRAQMPDTFAALAREAERRSHT
jgi:hypothetical protein